MTQPAPLPVEPAPIVHPAQQHLLDFLRKGVGEDLAAVTFDAVQEHSVRFAVLETFRLTAVSHPSTVAGARRPDATCRHVEPGHYARAVDRLLHEEANSEAVRAHCVGAIGAFDYCACKASSGQLRLHTNRERVLAHRGCSTCDTNGDVECTTCRGTAKVKCSYCHGNKRVRCRTCHGAGFNNRQVEVRANGEHVRWTSVREHCRDCHSGYVTCNHCDYAGMVVCTACSRGRRRCIPCAGTGWFTDITGVTTEATYSPSFELLGDAPAVTVDDIRHFLDRTDWLGPVQGHAHVGERTLNSAGTEVRVRHEFTAPLHGYQARVAAKSARVRHFGLLHHIMDGGALATEMVSSRVNALEHKLLKGLALWSPKFPARLKSALNDVFKPPLHAQAVQGFAQAKDTSKRNREGVYWAGYEAVHRALDTQHVQRLFDTLHKALGRAHLRKTTVGVVAAALGGAALAFWCSSAQAASDVTTLLASGAVALGVLVTSGHAWGQQRTFNQGAGAAAPVLKAFARAHGTSMRWWHGLLYATVAAGAAFGLGLRPASLAQFSGHAALATAAVPGYSQGLGWTQGEVRSFFLGTATSPARQLELARSFESGANGVGTSECLAKYFYKKVEDNPASQRAGNQTYVIRAQAALVQLRQHKQPCALVLHTEIPNASLEKLVELRGQPGESHRLFQHLPR